MSPDFSYVGPAHTSLSTSNFKIFFSWYTSTRKRKNMFLQSQKSRQALRIDKQTSELTQSNIALENHAYRSMSAGSLGQVMFTLITWPFSENFCNLLSFTSLDKLMWFSLSNFAHQSPYLRLSELKTKLLAWKQKYIYPYIWLLTRRRECPDDEISKV